MSLSDLASFAVSGSAATALAALITNRLVPDERRGRPRQRDRARARAAASAPPVAARSAASGFVFFLTYFIAATARYSSSSSGSNSNGNGNSAPRSTGRAASDAFIVGATASVFARLFGPHPDAAVTPAGHRWSMPALEDDLVLAIDPGLTFAVHEILARVVARILSHRRQQQQQQQRYLGASVTTFLLAATSKALVTALTYPLHVAAAEATERRYSAAVAALAADAADADDDDEPLIMLTDDSAGNGTRTQAADRRAACQDARDGGDSGGGGRRHNILVVLLQMLRAEGPRPLYMGWLRAVVAAALGHGLTMALQRSIYAYLLRLVHASRQLPSPPPSQQPRTPTHVDRPDGAAATTAASPASSQPPRRAKTSPRRQQPAADHFEVPPASVLPTMPPAPPAPPAPAASSSPLPPPPPPPPQPQPPTPAPFADEDRMKVKNAVESWLESSSVASEGTVQCDDSISNVSSRHHPRPRHQPTKPAASTSTRRQHASSSSRASPSSRTSAFYPDAPPAISRLAAHVRAGRSRDRNDVDEDDSGSLIFNMVSKSPRVIRVGTDDL